MTDAPDVAFSFNEIEALATKAARGAGLGWGHAEDIGRAARWLARYDVRWTQPLLRLLEGADAPARVTALMRAVDRTCGAGVGDSATVEGDDAGWVVPMLAAAIHGRDVAVVVRRADGTMRLEPDGSVRADGAGFDVAGGPASVAVVTRGGAPALSPLATVPRPAALRLADLTGLASYAARTAVPSSPASRARGAGSNRSDDD